MRERDFGMADGVALAMTALSRLALRRRSCHSLSALRGRLRLPAPRARRGLLRSTLSARCSWTAPIWPRWRCVPVEKARTTSAAATPGRACRGLRRRRTSSASRTRSPLLRRMQEAPDAPEDAGDPASADASPTSDRHPSEPAYGLADGHARSLHPPSPAHARPRLRLPLLRPGAALIFEDLPYAAVLGHRAGQIGHRCSTPAAEIDTLAQRQAGQPARSSARCTRTSTTPMP